MDIVPMDDVNVIQVGKETTVVIHIVEPTLLDFHTFARAAFYLLVILLSNGRRTVNFVNLMKFPLVLAIQPTLTVLPNGLLVASSHGSTANVTALLCSNAFHQIMLALTPSQIRFRIRKSLTVPFRL